MIHSHLKAGLKVKKRTPSSRKLNSVILTLSAEKISKESELQKFVVNLEGQFCQAEQKESHV